MRILIDYATQFVGLQYRGGVAEPTGGLDSSGLVIELLQSVGVLPPEFTGDAQALYDRFEKEGVINAHAQGSLCFYGTSVNSITHVGLLLEKTPPFRIIEVTRSGDSSDEAKAVVRIRPLKSRDDLVAVVKPYYFNNYR